MDKVQQKNITRRFKRTHDSLREISIETGILLNADGSCMVKFGNTHVICSATIEETLPHFLRNKGLGGWITAEYGMLPRSTHERVKREASSGKQSGRTQEIQRLIGRTLRAAVNLKKLGERQVLIDCDVINADGGTRCASITGSYVAMYLAIAKHMGRNLIRENPIISQVAAVSCGIIASQIMLDLDYDEDSSAEVDANFVLASDGRLLEVQASAEKNPFSTDELMWMIDLSKKGVAKLFAAQNKAIMNI
ncbi:MAG: ribonuclease PH [Rickettsiaceae bacterium]|nr:ribonuclease PH [Rickettsiaceae bacterium]